MKRASLPEFDRAVRNTYKLLLARGMLGSMSFSTDQETQRFLTGLMQAQAGRAGEDASAFAVSIGVSLRIQEK